MKKYRYFALLLIFLVIPLCSQSQNIAFSTILEGINNPASGKLQEELKKSNFTQVSPYKNRFKPEAWAYNYNPVNGAASAWVSYYFNPEILAKKKRKTVTVELTVRTFGPGNRLHAFLETQAKEKCKFSGTFTSETEGYWYNEYVHESGAYFQVYTMKEENYIKVRNTVLLNKD